MGNPYNTTFQSARDLFARLERENNVEHERIYLPSFGSSEIIISSSPSPTGPLDTPTPQSSVFAATYLLPEPSEPQSEYSFSDIYPNTNNSGWLEDWVFADRVPYLKGSQMGSLDNGTIFTK